MLISHSMCQSLKQTTKRIILSPGDWCFIRPDIDNLIKQVLDLAQPILFTNDSIVAQLAAKKVYDLNPRTEFTISVLS